MVLRVQFPDRHILQGFFRPMETGVFGSLLGSLSYNYAVAAFLHTFVTLASPE